LFSSHTSYRDWLWFQQQLFGPVVEAIHLPNEIAAESMHMAPLRLDESMLHRSTMKALRGTRGTVPEPHKTARCLMRSD